MKEGTEYAIVCSVYLFEFRLMENRYIAVFNLQCLENLVKVVGHPEIQTLLFFDSMQVKVAVVVN